MVDPRFGVLGTVVVFAVACASEPPTAPKRDAAIPHDAGTVVESDAGVERDAGVVDAGHEPQRDAGTACIAGSAACPLVIDRFPYMHASDTSTSTNLDVDAYDCAPTIDESGPEIHYRFELTEAGVLTATVDDVPGDRVDIDVHLLFASSCIARDNAEIREPLEPGWYELVLDTWVDGNGTALAGPYVLTVDFVPSGNGNCATVPTDLRMFWSSCAPGIDCFERNGERFLSTPTVGPVVKEAHLVTVDEDFAGRWPMSFTDRIDRHYAVSEGTTGYVATRGEPWAPAGEGGSEFGQGATGAPVPVLDEAWYINMYWRDRPARGTRMIVQNPRNGRAVVASAGFETGPGANTAIAGVVEEVHLYLGTSHRDDLEIGFAVDQKLPLGPIICP